MNKELINYRMERSKETLKDAKVMFERGSLFSTVNRIYYSNFYAVIALLLTKDLSSPKHSGVRSIFNKEFIKTGFIKERFGDFYNKMFEFRHKGDYVDFVKFEREKVESWFKSAEEFIITIDEIINKIISERK